MTSQTERDGNRIVVGMDLTANGDQALREAMRLARRAHGSELHVVHVIQTPAGLHDAKRLDRLATELRGRIAELGARVTALRGGAMDSAPRTEDIALHIRLGDPATALHQVAIDVDADLIVVSSHGRRGVERWIQGSVAEALIRIARVPVLVAHEKDFHGLSRSDNAEPPRLDAELSSLALTERMPTHVHAHAQFTPVSWHISGLL